MTALLLGQAALGFGQTQAPAGWSVRDLTPPDAWSWLSAVGEKIQVGSVSIVLDLDGPFGPLTDDRIGCWQGIRESFRELNSSGARSLGVSAVWGELLVGGFAPVSSNSGDIHAALWPSPATPPIDLNPAGYMSSRLRATNGRQHVGSANANPYDPGTVSVPLLWTGTSAVAVALPLPPGAKGAEAAAISTTQQGGSAGFGNIGDVFRYSNASHAMLWHGPDGRVVDLHPRGATESWVLAMTDVYQAGEVNYSTNYEQHQAAMWFGSPGSVRILAEPGSSVRAASGPYQIGTAMINGRQRAMLWASSADSSVDLHAFLPTGFSSSAAVSLWSDGSKIMIGGSASAAADGGPHAILWVYSPPVPLSFTSVPQSLTVAAGSSFVLTASAAADRVISFQWQRDGIDIAGATNTTLLDTRPGTYRVVATTSAGSLESPAAEVSQAAVSDTSRLSNVSIRAATPRDADPLILGAVIGGLGSQPILARAAGPALSVYGVTGFLPDPVLAIVRDGLVIAGNDNWGGAPAASMAAAAVGAFPFPAGSLDAAAATSLPPGAYSFHVSGKNGAAGLVLAELYDATPTETFTRGSPRLLNVSVRTRVAADAPVAVAGFAIAGATAKTVLIRAVGPGLSALGLDGVLADPKLQLFSGSTLLYENDDWGGSALLASTAASVGAFPLASPFSRDAVLWVTLPPGSYTAQVSGVGSAVGTVLVEIYDASRL